MFTPKPQEDPELLVRGRSGDLNVPNPHTTCKPTALNISKHHGESWASIHSHPGDWFENISKAVEMVVNVSLLT